MLVYLLLSILQGGQGLCPSVPYSISSTWSWPVSCPLGNQVGRHLSSILWTKKQRLKEEGAFPRARLPGPKAWLPSHPVHDLRWPALHNHSDTKEQKIQREEAQSPTSVDSPEPHSA
ncbi:hypothetical protein H1C71_037613 [Ictidomys tridecemlineatus]|nr:hypothetical protein H1C71_037613 [Ictidomys tridecemlineatus]